MNGTDENQVTYLFCCQHKSGVSLLKVLKSLNYSNIYLISLRYLPNVRLISLKIIVFYILKR